MKPPSVSHPLSPQQERLWLLQGTDPSSSFRAQCTIRIEGHLDHSVLHEALREVVLRHDILRTTYRSEDGLPALQCVKENPSLAYSVELLDDSATGALDSGQIQDFPALDPGEAASFHARLIKQSRKSHLLICNLPALSMDRYSILVLMRDIADSYDSIVSGVVQREAPWQYADFAAWQKDVLEAEDDSSRQGIWNKQDLSALLTMRLPFERSRVTDRFSPQHFKAAFDPQLVAALEHLAEEINVSLRSIYLGAWFRFFEDLRVRQKWSWRPPSAAGLIWNFKMVLGSMRAICQSLFPWLLPKTSSAW